MVIYDLKYNCFYKCKELQYTIFVQDESIYDEKAGTPPPQKIQQQYKPIYEKRKIQEAQICTVYILFSEEGFV